MPPSSLNGTPNPWARLPSCKVLEPGILVLYPSPEPLGQNSMPPNSLAMPPFLLAFCLKAHLESPCTKARFLSSGTRPQNFQAKLSRRSRQTFKDSRRPSDPLPRSPPFTLREKTVQGKGTTNHNSSLDHPFVFSFFPSPISLAL